MEFPTIDNSIIQALQIMAEETITEVVAGLDIKTTLHGTAFTLEDGVFISFMEAGLLLQRAARILAETEDLTNPEMRITIAEGLQIAMDAQPFIDKAARARASA